MGYRFIPALLLVFFVSGLAAGQQHFPAGCRFIHIASRNTSFPDTGRMKGHIYDSVLYDAPAHYKDSSVLIVVPDQLAPGKKLDLVFWFHGWRNNIDTAVIYYHLAEQFIGARKNAVLVLAETAKNSPDSYGGKLEQKNVFKGLVMDILSALINKKIVPAQCEVQNIILAGHSGAFRVIARILQQGGMAVQEVDLFDALYGEVDQYKNWILLNKDNRFMNWYTNQGGGTDQVSLEMMEALRKENLPVLSVEETTLSSSILKKNRIVFVHSTRAHNDIIFNPDNFKLLLESSPFLK